MNFAKTRKALGTSVLLDELAKAETDVLRYERIAVEKLGRGSEATSAGNAIRVDLEKIQQILAAKEALQHENLNPEVRQFIESASKTLASLDAQPIPDVLNDVFQSVKSIAGGLGKENPEIVLNTGSFMIRNKARGMMNDVFMHLFRNAIDHGIEKPEERIRKNKPVAGTIALSATEQAGQLLLTIQDDGQGLALEKLRAKALQSGALSEEEAQSDQRVAEMIFLSGLSTAEAVTDVSGRGVGMEAVKEFLERNGGGIRLHLREEPAQTGFRAFETVITLPGFMYTQPA